MRRGSCARRRRSMALLVGCAMAAAPGLCHAAADFDPSSEQWHGLDALTGLAAEAKVQLMTSRRLDWGQLDEHTVLFLVGPEVSPTAADRASLQGFLEAGGKLVVADDFGSGRAWLQGAPIAWSDAPGRSRRVYAGQPSLPMVQLDTDPARLAEVPWRRGEKERSPAAFLSHNLRQPLVLNHAASVQARSGAVLWGAFDLCTAGDKCGWLAEAAWHGGRVLAVADGSVLTNQMIGQIHENRQFAANLLRYYCVAERPCRVRLVGALQATSGTFVPHHRDDSWWSRRGLAAVDDVLRAVATAVQGRSGWMAWLSLAALACLAWAVRRELRPYQPMVPSHLPAPRARSLVRETVAAWLDSPHADYRPPARLLAAQLMRTLALADPSVQPLRSGAVQRPSRLPSGAWRQAPTAVDSLVRRGQLAPDSAARLRTILATLQHLTREDGPPLSQHRFGELAAEMDWAETLLQHTRPDEANHLRGHPR